MTQLDLFNFPSPAKKLKSFNRVLSDAEAKARGLPYEKGQQIGHRYFAGYRIIEALYEDERDAYDNPKIVPMWKDKVRTDEHNDYLKQTSTNNRKFLNRVKRRYGCSLCGWKVPEDKKMFYSLLHCDHIDSKTKSFDIGRQLARPRISIKKELRKCRILCMECHHKTDNFGAGAHEGKKKYAKYEHKYRPTVMRKWKA